MTAMDMPVYNNEMDQNTYEKENVAKNETKVENIVQPLNI